MTDQLKPTTERARKRAAGKILRDLSIRRRETYFDLLVSGYSIEQIASSHQDERIGGSSRCRPGPGETASRCA